MTFTAGNASNVPSFELGTYPGQTANELLPAGPITYSFDAGWSAAEQAAAASAFRLWGGPSGLTFTAVASGGMVSLVKNTLGQAFQQVTATDAAGHVAASTISIDTTTPGTGFNDLVTLGGYGNGTLVHEIGHLMGLGHPGAYNGEGGSLSSGYRAGTVFDTDTSMYSIESYNDATLTGGNNVPAGGTEVYAGTPMQYDLVAVERAYGAHPLAAGTVFGFHSNTGLPEFTFTAAAHPVLTISNGGAAGGVLDLSGFAADATVDLHPGAFSSVAGLVKNLAIGLDTTLVRVVGGGGNNVVTGNDAGDTLVAGGANNTLTGGAGNDTFVLGAAPGTETLTGGGGSDTAQYALGLRGTAHGALSGAGSETFTHGGHTDTLTGIGTIGLADGTLSYDPMGAAAGVVRLYDAGLGRVPDQAGLDYWVGALGHGATLGQLGSSFAGSAEFTSRFGGGLVDGAYVDQVYTNVLGRGADAAGKAYWTGVLGGGGTRGDVLAGIANAPESVADQSAVTGAGIFVDSGAADQVARLYDTAFGRAPDLGGELYWRGLIDAGTAGLMAEANAFVGSAEFAAKYGVLGNRDFVTAEYGNALHRAADAAGVNYWTGVLDSGASRAAVVIGFSESGEHVALTSSTIGGGAPATYGILFA